MLKDRSELLNLVASQRRQIRELNGELAEKEHEVEKLQNIIKELRKPSTKPKTTKKPAAKKTTKKKPGRPKKAK